MISVLKIEDLIFAERGSWKYRKDECLKFPVIEVYRDCTSGLNLLITLRTSYNGNQYACRETYNWCGRKSTKFNLQEFVKEGLLNKLLNLMNLSLN